MIMCVLLCYPVSIHMSQLLSTGRLISSLLINGVILLLNCLVSILHLHIHYLSLRHSCLYLNHCLDLHITDSALKVS